MAKKKKPKTSAASSVEPHIEKAIRKAFPDGVIDWSFHENENWLEDLLPELRLELGRLPGVRFLYEGPGESGDAPPWADSYGDAYSSSKP